MRERRIIAASLIALGLLASQEGAAQQRKAYKYVDGNGQVVYSQTPPLDGRRAKSIDISPAYRGHGGYVGSVYAYHAGRADSSFDGQAHDAQRHRAEDAGKERVAALEAYCNRHRGTDCSDPETLAYIDSTRIPRPALPVTRRPLRN